MIHCVQHYSENSGQEKRTVIAVAEPAAAIAAIEMTVGEPVEPTEVTSATEPMVIEPFDTLMVTPVEMTVASTTSTSSVTSATRKRLYKNEYIV